jgi:hypothetical protein
MNTSDIRLFESERKEEITKIIVDHNLPLQWEDGVDGGIVSTDPSYNWKTNPYNFSQFDELVLSLDPPIPEADLVPVGGIEAADTPVFVSEKAVNVTELYLRSEKNE